MSLFVSKEIEEKIDLSSIENEGKNYSLSTGDFTVDCEILSIKNKIKKTVFKLKAQPGILDIYFSRNNFKLKKNNFEIENFYHKSIIKLVEDNNNFIVLLKTEK